MKTVIKMRKVYYGRFVDFMPSYNNPNAPIGAQIY